MSDTFPTLIGLVQATLRDPRAAARHILALQLPERTLWEVLALGVLLTVILLEGMDLMATQDATDPTTQMLGEVYGQPFLVTLGQAINSVIMVFAVFHVGRIFGGIGDRAGAVALVAWHQIVLLIAGIGAVVIGAIVPAVMPVLLVGLIGFYFYLLTQFVCALHGFDSGVPVFGMIILTMIGIYLLISVVTGLLAAIFLGAPPNV
jgi:hypothetical protein